MFSFEWGNPLADPMTIFMMLTLAIPPLRTYFGGWENFTPSPGKEGELIVAFFTDPYFLLATAAVIATVYVSHSGGYVKLSPGELRAANWYLLCGAYIHFLMDGLVGCYGVWGLMRRAYETLDGRFPHAAGSDDPFKVGQGSKRFSAPSGPAAPPVPVRVAVPNFSVPFVVGHLEMLVYFPLCLALYYAYKKGLPWRRPLEIVVAVCQLFGAILFMGAEEVLDSPNLFILGHETGLGKVTVAHWLDVLCFYWFAYFFANLIWVFVPIPLIWKAMSEIAEGKIATRYPWVHPEGFVEDIVEIEPEEEGDEDTEWGTADDAELDDIDIDTLAEGQEDDDVEEPEPGPRRRRR